MRNRKGLIGKKFFNFMADYSMVVYTVKEKMKTGPHTGLYRLETNRKQEDPWIFGDWYTNKDNILSLTPYTLEK